MLAAILFDLDGTLVNTDPLHYEIWRSILRNYELEIDEKFYKTHISGRLNPQIIQDLLPQLSVEEGHQLADKKEAIFREQAPSLQRLQGLTELLDWTQKYQIKRALVTNAPKLNAHFMLDVLNLKASFDTVVIAEDETAPKPDPTPYRVALQRLGVSASSAIALEDSPSGMRSAVSAGVSTIGVTTTQNSQALHALGAFMTIPDFTDNQLWTFLNSVI